VLGGPNFGIFVAPDGSEFASIATDPGNFVSNIDHRVSHRVAAATDDGPRGCTVATLKGRYPFAAVGTLYPPAFGVTEPTPAADAGYQLINGDGTGTDTVTLRVGGVIVLENVVLPTSYTVNANCTGTKSVLGGPNFGIFVAPDGSEFASIATDPGNFVSNIDHRVSHK